MKKHLFLAIAMLVSGTASAVTDHYVLRDGNHVYHMKITKLGDEISVNADVNFEPNADEKGGHACSADISGEAKLVSENELVMKKRIEHETHFCTLQIHLTPDGAKIDQSQDCHYYAAGLCHFDSNGKELLKIK